jgi:hypothetical protein
MVARENGHHFTVPKIGDSVENYIMMLTFARGSRWRRLGKKILY